MNIMQVFKQFPTQESCVSHLEKVRWNGRPRCAYCESNTVSRHIQKKQQNRWQCSRCQKSFSVTVGTIFHRTHLPLQKWFLAISLMLNAKKGISSRQLARDLELPVETAWSLGHRIRKAMTQDQGKLLMGIVEMDETYIGGKPRKGKDIDNKRGRGTKKQAVVGMIERGGDVKSTVAKNNRLNFKVLSELVRNGIDTDNSVLFTDEFKAYNQMKTIIEHKQVDHSKGVYSVNGVSTNSMESFWAIVKRGMVGQFHKVSTKYLQKYLDEFCFRFNNRDNDMVFDKLVGMAVLSV